MGNDLSTGQKGMSFLPRNKYGVNSSRNPDYSFTDPFIEILPGWVIPLYQFQLPCSFPFLYLFFPLERRLPRFVGFIPNQTVNIVFTRKAIHQIVFVLVYPFNKVGRHACIYGAVAFATFATKDVNVKILQELIFLDSRLRGNDTQLEVCDDFENLEHRSLGKHSSFIIIWQGFIPNVSKC